MPENTATRIGWAQQLGNLVIKYCFMWQNIKYKLSDNFSGIFKERLITKYIILIIAKHVNKDHPT